ncbi:hypothetical protein [Phenylobacterium sp.]|uniref:hypothetical protein n=1 Tax=Phenylobacterium sp. TaxID=1871053 RepID=UPI00286D0F85|nr:hypothetical protein [Phenylobacterium sp.]
MAKRILIQTTIPPIDDDWHIGRFSMLVDHLQGLTDESGAAVYDVVARDRAAGPEGFDPLLASLDESDFAQLWLFAVDVGDGLTPDECAAISRFRAKGGGLMVTRDHMDLGSSVCTLGGVGKAHHFHSQNPEADESRRRIDDVETSYILWPNYHSGPNGDVQPVTAEGAVHPVLRDGEAPGGVLRFLPAHPHEGAVSAPADEPSARVIATGVSRVTGARFNLVVAFEAEDGGAGRAIAQSTFHHFCDYNWDPRTGCPSFVSEPPSDRIITDPRGLAATHRYVENLADWLS